MRFVTTLLSAIGILFAMGCSNTSTPTNPNDALTSSKNRFTVNGGGYTNAQWKGYLSEATLRAFVAEAGGTGNVSVSGLTTVPNETFTLLFLCPASTPGTYVVNPSTGTSMTMIYGSTSRTLFAQSGTIVISQFDAIGGRAKGTFSGSFTAIDDSGITIEVTDGVFDVPVVAEP